MIDLAAIFAQLITALNFVPLQVRICILSEKTRTKGGLVNCCEGRKEFNNKVKNSCNSFFDVLADDDDVSLLLLLINFLLKRDEIDLSRQKFSIQTNLFPSYSITSSDADDQMESGGK